MIKQLSSTLLTELAAALYGLKTTNMWWVAQNSTDIKAISTQLSWRLAGWLGLSLAIIIIMIMTSSSRSVKLGDTR